MTLNELPSFNMLDHVRGLIRRGEALPDNMHIGVPCGKGHGYIGKNARYNKSNTCVQCSTYRSRKRMYTAKQENVSKQIELDRLLRDRADAKDDWFDDF